MKTWLLQMLRWDMYGGLIVFGFTFTIAFWVIYDFVKMAWNDFWEE